MNKAGIHLTIDGFTSDKAVLGNFERVYVALDKVPSVLGVHHLTKPHVVWDTECDDEKKGISGFVMIKESHISIHTFPEKGFVAIDVYSCKKFSVDKAVTFFKDQFSLEKIEKCVVNRFGFES